MPEENLAILRYLLDLSILALTTYQVHVITHSWQGALKEVDHKRSHLERESHWRARLIRILSHDIKEPIVGALQMVRKLRKNPDPERQSSLINQLENSQMMIREIISNVESYSATSEDLELPTQTLSLPVVLEKLSPWIRSRIEEKKSHSDLNRPPLPTPFGRIRNHSRIKWCSISFRTRSSFLPKARGWSSKPVRPEHQRRGSSATRVRASLRMPLQARDSVSPAPRANPDRDSVFASRA